MQIGAAELRDLASAVDDQHHEAMRTVRDDLAELHHGDTGRLLRRSRRRFLQQAGAGGAVIVVGPALVPIGRFLPGAAAQSLSDTDIAVFAESVELAAVDAYTVAAGSGKLDPAVVEVGTMFAGHHRDHAGAFAGLAGAAATGRSNAALLDVFGPMLQQAPDQAALLEIARQLEEGAAATYLFALGALQSAEAARATASILPVESQHAVVLAQALGTPVAEYVPSFQTTAAALDPAQFPAN